MLSPPHLTWRKDKLQHTRRCHGALNAWHVIRYSRVTFRRKINIGVPPHFSLIHVSWNKRARHPTLIPCFGAITSPWFKASSCNWATPPIFWGVISEKCVLVDAFCCHRFAPKQWFSTQSWETSRRPTFLLPATKTVWRSPNMGFRNTAPETSNWFLLMFFWMIWNFLISKLEVFKR